MRARKDSTDNDMQHLDTTKTKWPALYQANKHQNRSKCRLYESF